MTNSSVRLFLRGNVLFLLKISNVKKNAYIGGSHNHLKNSIMKRSLTLLLVCVVVSCAKDSSVNEVTLSFVTSSKLEMLIEKAEGYRAGLISTKSENICVDRSKIYYICDIPTKSDLADTLMCVLNFKDDKGFAVIPENQAVADLIAVTEKGFYDGTPTGVWGFDAYMEQMTSYVRNYEAQSLSEEIGEVKTRASSSQKIVNPIIPVSWNQDAPFNWYCSNPYDAETPAGCVAVSIAQAMSVFEYPTTIKLTYSGATSSEISLDWKNMIAHAYSAFCTRGVCGVCGQNAMLLREIGERVKMNYGKGGSGADALKLTKSCLASFGMSCNDYVDFLPSPITSSLDKKYPVIVLGWEKDYSAGHAWNIDGYEYYSSTKYQYDMSGMTVGTSTTESWYVYFKYGWGGINDGKYLSYQKITGSGSYASNGKTAVSTPVTVFSDNGGCDYGVKICINIKKDE